MPAPKHWWVVLDADGNIVHVAWYSPVLRSRDQARGLKLQACLRELREHPRPYTVHKLVEEN